MRQQIINSCSFIVRLWILDRLMNLFIIDNICLLLDKCYQHDFTNYEELLLKMEIYHNQHNIV